MWDEALGVLERALTCRTLRRLDRWRPCARAAPRRSTLLSGRVPAGPWQSGEETEATVRFPSLSPSLRVDREGVRGSAPSQSYTFLYTALPTSAPQLA